MLDAVQASRRKFIAATWALAAVAASRVEGAPQESPPPASDEEGRPPEPDAAAITTATLAEAEKLAGIEFTEAEREVIVRTIGPNIERFRRRRRHVLANGTGPACVFDPRLPGMDFPDTSAPLRQAHVDPGPMPDDESDIAFAPVTALGGWIRRGQLTSERLTRIYLDRLKRIGPKLECTITLTEDLARRQATQADRELAAGHDRGPLHGVPWGAKDLLDTAGIATTWGAHPYQDRVATEDAAVVRRLQDAGAVLVAKLTLGALAYGDIWFGGRTNNPFNLEQGSSGSSAGSASATAAGLVGFSLGTETLGSIVSPCMRCGATGLRPTFGRVARTGAMALCWSLDKIGPIARTVEDTALVLDAIHGSDPGDPSSLDMPYSFDGTKSVRGLRLGYDPAWFERASDLDQAALDAAKRAGLDLVEVGLPDWPYGTLMTILMAEAAAAFEELTLTDRDDELEWQAPQAWPNSFRETWFAPAIELVQAERFRRDVAQMMAGRFARVDAMISPSYAGSLLLITNNTGHPSLTLRCGFRDNGTPHGITLWGRLFDEGTLCSIGMALERELDVWHRRPEL